MVNYVNKYFFFSEMQMEGVTIFTTTAKILLTLSTHPKQKETEKPHTLYLHFPNLYKPFSKKHRINYKFIP